LYGLLRLLTDAACHPPLWRH